MFLPTFSKSISAMHPAYPKTLDCDPVPEKRMKEKNSIYLLDNTEGLF